VPLGALALAKHVDLATGHLGLRDTIDSQNPLRDSSK
jgi:hypothetical protein